ncbi:Fructosamine-3-kinase [Acetitomaculum ruminis DSM 5522]|uniref:Fructosamine-3-kinase n=1 Tax=Acetitomaculum ruminis DSM 5522 TaxID=1120918 RepID=A0A1I0WDW5_9FIRM|nr:fructosamine kinase family protein [Acetitomaculum ruminis]SFA86912.1 Fructosamine-3-kinase [Acetitomaculum ruminis DSM 5522]
MDIKNFGYGSLDEAIKALNKDSTTITGSVKLSGGDINEAYMLKLSNDKRVFLKSNKSKETEFFEAEAQGLLAIHATKTIAVPQVLCGGNDSDRGAFLILEYLDNVGKVKGYWSIFAEELANMHKADAVNFVKAGKYGFLNNNYIGSRKQINTSYDKWVDFFRECRLIPLFENAETYFDNSMIKNINRLLDNLDKWLLEPERPSLLHGDLWSGNFITGNDGKAWLIDPAVYVGHAEADIAMTELFGGFVEEFYHTYADSKLLGYGYEDRRNLYNLYHLLNHLISFGGSYYDPVIRIIKYYIG